MTERHAEHRRSSVRHVAGHYSRLELPEGTDERPFVYINMVSSVDGKSTVDGSEQGLGSADDKRMMQELRVHADAVLNGASTLRVSGSTPRVLPADLRGQRRERGLAPQPLGVVVTRSGDLPLDATFFTSSEFDGLVIATDRTPPERIERMRATGRHVALVPDYPGNGVEIVQLLRREYGVRRLLCEGGATMNETLIASQVADQLCLTLAPWIVGGRDNLTTVEGPAYHRDTMPRLRLLQELHDTETGELFLRYAFEYRAVTPGATR